MNHFIATVDLLNALKTECEAIELSPGEKLFKRVKFYATPDAVRALNELGIYEDRACILIPSGDQFENHFSGRDLRSQVTREIIMLVSDRHVGDATAALVGNDSKAGVAAIKDLVIQELLGEQLGFGPRLVRLRPESTDPIFLSVEDQKKQRGRWVWQITWLADAGHTSVTPTQ